MSTETTKETGLEIAARMPHDYIGKNKRRTGTIAFDAYVRNRADDRFYLGRAETREEAQAMIDCFRATGERPKSMCRIKGAGIRHAEAMERKLVNGSTRWDVRGREGHREKMKRIHVGTFDTFADAIIWRDAFIATGKTRKRKSSGIKAAPVIRATRGATRAPVPVRNDRPSAAVGGWREALRRVNERRMVDYIHAA